MNNEQIETNLRIASFLDALPTGLSLQHISNRMRCVFGKDAWKLSRIQTYLGRSDEQPTTGRPHALKADIELQAYFLDNQHALSIDELLIKAQGAFPAKKLPSRSALHRFLQNSRTL